MPKALIIVFNLYCIYTKKKFIIALEQALLLCVKFN